VLKNSGVGDAFNNIGKQLKDGHWVLAFPSVEAANYATLLVDQHAAKLRAYYCEVWRRALLKQDAIVDSPGYCILCFPSATAHRSARRQAARLPLRGVLRFVESVNGL